MKSIRISSHSCAMFSIAVILMSSSCLYMLNELILGSIYKVFKGKKGFELQDRNFFDYSINILDNFKNFASVKLGKEKEHRNQTYFTI